MSKLSNPKIMKIYGSSELHLVLLLSCVSLLNMCCIRADVMSNSLSPNNSIESGLSVGGKSGWNTRLLSPKFEDKASTVFFIDSQNGWVGGKRALYKTSNSGLSWEKIGFPISEDEFVTEIIFINLANGLVIVKKNITPYSSFTDNKFRILSTANYGKTWDEINSQDGGVTSVRFDDAGRIWLSGLTYRKKNSPACVNPLLLTYDIGVAKWNSNESLIEAMTTDTGSAKMECLNKAVMGVDISSDGKVRIITSDREIYEEEKSSWKKTYKINIFDDQGVPSTFGTTDSQFPWFLEGTDSEEGTRGRLVICSKNGEFNETTHNGYLFTDAVFISNEEFLISGSKVNLIENKKTGMFVRSSIGVVLQTVDNGKHFNEIYSSVHEERINRLYKVAKQNKNVWALGESGSLVELTRVSEFIK